MVVAAHEAERPPRRRRRRTAGDQRRAEVAQQHQGAGPVAVVGLVAHLQHLAEDRGHVDRLARPARPRCSSGPEHVAHPAQPLEHLGAVGAVAQDLAEPLVEGAVGAGAGGGVLEHEHPHARADHAGHRPDGAAVVARLEARPRCRASNSATASSGSATRPSSAAAPISAPRSGPDARSQVIGGRRGGTPRRPGRAPPAPVRRRPAAPAPPASLERRGVGLGPQRVERDRGQVILGARERRTPVDRGHRDGLVARPPGEQVDADAHDARSCLTSEELQRPTRRAGVGQVHLGAGRDAARRPGASRSCGSWAVPTTLTTTGGRAPAIAGASERGGVGLGAVAQHHVEQHHGGRRVGRDLGQPGSGAGSGRSSGGPGRSCRRRRRSRPA